MRNWLLNFSPHTRSLKTQLAFYFIPATLIPVFMLGFFATQAFDQNDTESLKRQAVTERQLIQGEIDSLEKKLVQQLRRASQQGRIQKSIESKNKRVMKQALGSLSGAGEFRLYDVHGDFLAESEIEDRKKPRINFVPRHVLKKLKKSGMIVDRYFSEDGSGLLFLGRILIKNGTTLFGILEHEFYFGASQLSELNRRRQIEAVFIKRDFSTAASSMALGKSELKSLSQLVSQTSNDQQSFIKNIVLGESRYASFLFDLPSFGNRDKNWAYLGILVPLAQRDEASRQLRVNILLIAVFLCVAFGLLIFLFSNRIVRPIETLVLAMKSVKMGSLEEIPQVESNYEIGYLIQAFNEMIRNLGVARQALERKINELESANSEIKSTQSTLLHSAKMISLGQIVAGVAHELNNPVAFIYSNMHHLSDYIQKVSKMVSEYKKLKALVPEGEREKIEKLEKELDIQFILSDMPELSRSCLDGANRTKEIVTGLRTFSRMDETTFREADIHECIDSTLKLLRAEFKDRIKIVREYGSIPPVECSSSQVNQVLMNLIANAVQAINGNGTISIRTRSKEGKVEIEIEDSGHGMSEQTLSRIFDPFFTTKSVGEGTGLGLSIAYGLVQKHQGNIFVTSQMGRGTKFVVVLPIQQKLKNVGS